jgi:hypothetical protein
MKQRIMQALLNYNNGLTKEEIMWAASHLPGTEETGEYETSDVHYNHEADDLFSAIGATKADAEKVADVMATAVAKVATKDKYRYSHAIEEVMNCSKDAKFFFPIVIAKIIKDAIDHAQKSSIEDKLKELLKKMKGSDDE